jgi:hypothetical protein
MKKLLPFLCFITLLSCNDGDIIVTSFDFNDASLQACSGTGGYLFFKINEGNTESLSLRLAITEDLFKTNNSLVRVLDGNSNFANYRVYDGAVDSDYFCNEVPPTLPLVSIEYIANSGTATLTTIAVFDDADGLPLIDSADEEMEGTGDFDKDLIPNYYDFDDDGDNVPTAAELDIENEDGDNDPLTNPLDTDGDGMPDYLDEDDDGDGILTRYEANGTLDPVQIETDPTVGPDYLNPAIAKEVIVDEFREHNYDFISDITLILSNLVLINGEEQITRETLNMDGIDSFSSGNILITPPFPEN